MAYGKMPLPSITICNENPIRESKLLAHEDADEITKIYKDIVHHKHGQVKTLLYSWIAKSTQLSLAECFFKTLHKIKLPVN